MDSAEGRRYTGLDEEIEMPRSTARGVFVRLKEDIKPVTYMKTRSAELLQKVNESRRPVVITQNGEAKAVVLDVDSYEELRDATLILKLVAQAEAEIEAGLAVPQEEVFTRIEADAQAGKLDAMAQKALRDHAAGKTTPL
jgi:prevent-host-death family protein